MQGRRHFLQVVGSGASALALGAGAAGCSSGTEGQAEASGAINAGNVSALAVGVPSVVAGSPVVVFLDATGVYAMSTICTHQQCDIRNDGSITASGLSCSCHGSAFDTDGNVTQGPANQPLPHWQVTIASDGTITVDGGTAVSESTRVAVPAA